MEFIVEIYNDNDDHMGFVGADGPCTYDISQAKRFTEREEARVLIIQMEKENPGWYFDIVDAHR